MNEIQIITYIKKGALVSVPAACIDAECQLDKQYKAEIDLPNKTGTPTTFHFIFEVTNKQKSASGFETPSSAMGIIENLEEDFGLPPNVDNYKIYNIKIIDKKYKIA
ncbi:MULTISPECIES: hypothetical protein [unclassified Pseudovibrio]|uniref:hypothetical protein n=1 Tax=unclassified Pseudovibrio TaxID=2627060 RepID=UPI0007AE3966|nr:MULTISPECIES: hypothetical protein [unclassified Pseudovibrio]KZK94607.1 hypothetical protein PsW74_04484 [Pseudovibrio sp. W74]KZL04504.1 hypothetical protein PsAD14_05569 [Pseudovibrio sp. Ad14]